MLNIPESVKTLFKRDGVRKNFRVHFPNGELPDITNDNVVQESVKFTESLCSQDVLKFGLTEASVIEFETVGIPNMYGMTIECGIEIDLSSLPASELSAIEADQGEGTYVALADSDIGYAFYRVPYGVFRIESCPRDHQAMAHRKVQAYSAGGYSIGNPYEEKKTQRFFPNNVYDPSLSNLAISNLFYESDESMASAGFEHIALTQLATTPTTKCGGYNIPTDSTSLSLGIIVEYEIWGNKSINEYYPRYELLEPNDLYGVELNYDYSSLFKTIVDKLKQQGAKSSGRVTVVKGQYDTETITYSSYDELVYALLGTAFKSNFMGYSPLIPSFKAEDLNVFFPTIHYMYSLKVPDTTTYRVKATSVAIKNDNFAIYPFISSKERDSTYINLQTFITIPKKIGLYNGTWNTSVSPPEFTISDTIYEETINNPATIYQQAYNEQEPLIAGSLQIQSTLQTTDSNDTGQSIYSFSNGYSITGIVNGYLELLACFGVVNRSGGFNFKRLANLSSIPILPSEYKSFWWDEYNVLPLGTVKYSFTDETGAENNAFYQFGTGASIYDMSGNEAIKALSAQDEATINSLLDDYFIPYLAPIAFTPIDMTMKGLPYMETGDYLAVTAEDGTIANSFNMNMEISGIQVLTANIESTSGDIIESEEGET